MTAPSAALNAARRARDLDELSRGRPVDVLVVGGGSTGAGIALDAACRGLSVVLAEKHDLAFGTSRWSSKLIHGGLRYLASGQLGIARESAVERGILLTRTAPHLVRALPQLVPLTPAVSRANAALVGAGFLAGDLLRATAGTPGHVLPPPRRVSATEVHRHAPTIRTDQLRGGLLSWDGQAHDDARLVVAIARTAARHGARILTRCAAEQVTGRGAVLRDQLTGQAISLDARVVINATGVWAGQVAPGVALRPSRGTHLVLAQDSFGGLAAGLTVPVPGEHNRFVFALPAPDRRVYVGLTDEPAPGPVPDIPHATPAEIDFLLDTINAVLRTPLSHADVLGTFSGLRPLLDTGTGRTADLSRRHQVHTAPDGLVTVVGGKLTTYRRMAEDALDAALRAAGIPHRPCRTHRLPLVGAATRAQLAAIAAPRRLVRRYGTEAPAVLAQAQGDPRLLEPITEDTATTTAELLFAIRHEGALDEADLLDRRTRIGLVPAARTRALPAARAALDHALPH
ncbi:glycerol-3-phosphate dehydrogenase/oxidase [Goodfellowiella coeruleoviolacea]|uniref:Glycerol-3-phosphate dehydrogenase n=1 Tax=Goodfellowiella coeruleoviolacea TaxID=334858 RepID=A0AAE3GA19_9PSEU|nr:glycerol-3-phosphate dehydrogenase/oxidase [Goodfellowiella coeruleoviolacea]MCP2164275.1 glycerol-3-phosphate dehydrogenase [Goodfellowiella coeruleoviolacea]